MDFCDSTTNLQLQPTLMELSQPESPQWFAVHTYPRHEKRVASELGYKGLEEIGRAHV